MNPWQIKFCRRKDGIIIKQEIKEKGSVIYRRYRKCKITGKIYDAWQYGYKAWPIIVNKSTKS